MNVYIACGLTHVPREEFQSYVAFVHGLAAAIVELGHHVRYALKDSDPQLANKPATDRARLCYVWDRKLVESADILVADATYPSIGLGIELQLAENRDTPIVLAFNDEAKHRASAAPYVNPDHSKHTLQIGEGFVSLMALGLPSILNVVRYSGTQDGHARVCAALARFGRTSLTS
jgi:hypothetical protein